MGMYTGMKGQIKFPLHLVPYVKEYIDDDYGVISWLSFYDKEPEFSTKEFYDFVRCDRQSSVFISTSFYFNDNVRILELDDTGLLTCQFSMKNYDYELEKFIKWLRTSDIPHNLKPRYEECETPTIHVYKWEE